MGPSPLGGYQQFWLNITKLINIIYITFSSQTHTSKWYICKYLYIHIITRYMTRPQLTFRTVLRRWTSFTKKTFRFASRWNISTGFPATRILATRMKRRRRQVIELDIMSSKICHQKMSICDPTWYYHQLIAETLYRRGGGGKGGLWGGDRRYVPGDRLEEEGWRIIGINVIIIKMKIVYRKYGDDNGDNQGRIFGDDREDSGGTISGIISKMAASPSRPLPSCHFEDHPRNVQIVTNIVARWHFAPPDVSKSHYWWPNTGTPPHEEKYSLWFGKPSLTELIWSGYHVIWGYGAFVFRWLKSLKISSDIP